MFRLVTAGAQPLGQGRRQLLIDEKLHSAASTGWFTSADA